MANIWQAIHEHVAHDCHRMLRRILAGGAEAAAKSRTEREQKIAALGPWFFKGERAYLYPDPGSTCDTEWCARAAELSDLGFKPVVTKDALYLEDDAALEVQTAHDSVMIRLLARIPKALSRGAEDDVILPVEHFSGEEFAAFLGVMETELAGLAGTVKGYHTARDGNMEAIFCMGFGNIHLEGRAARMIKASLRAHGLPIAPVAEH